MIIEKPSRTYAWFHDVTTLDIEVNRGEGVGAHKVLAGSPIDENGNIANDETAIGLLMETVSDANPDGKIIVAGDVDALGAKNASGIELSGAAKSALSGITWREPDYVVEMPTGGGGGMMVVKITYNEDDDTLSCNHTFDEISNAFPNILFVDDVNTVGYTCSLVNDGIDAGLYASLWGTNVSGTTIEGFYTNQYIIRPNNTIEFNEYSE